MINIRAKNCFAFIILYNVSRLGKLIEIGISSFPSGITFRLT